MEVESPLGGPYRLIPLFVTATKNRNDTLDKLIKQSTTDLTEGTCWAVVNGKTRKSYQAVPTGPVKLQKNSELLKGATPLEVLKFWREHMGVESEDEVEELASTDVFGILDDQSQHDERVMLIEDFGEGLDASSRAQETAKVVEKMRGDRPDSPLEKDDRPIVNEDEVGSTPVAIAEDVTACRLRFRHALEMAQCYDVGSSGLERFREEDMYPDDEWESEPESK